LESEYLHSALKLTRFALRARRSPQNEEASLVILLLMAELEMRWNRLRRRANLPTPAEIRALI
jgi:hypothetical protein